MPGSPAIDAIPLAQEGDSVDQRGFPPPRDGADNAMPPRNGFDMGAFEQGAVGNAAILGFETLAG